MSSREQFEAWVVDFHIGAPLSKHIDKHEGSRLFGEYLYDDWIVQGAWAAWQASRAGIKLPEKLA